MLGVLSIPFINHSTPFIYDFLLTVPSPRKINYLTITRLMKIDDSSVNYSGENESILI